jgi:hypothetical protein
MGYCQNSVAVSGEHLQGSLVEDPVRAEMKMETVGVWYLNWVESCISGPIPPQLTDRKKCPRAWKGISQCHESDSRKLVDLTVWSLIFFLGHPGPQFPTLASA